MRIIFILFMAFSVGAIAQEFSEVNEREYEYSEGEGEGEGGAEGEVDTAPPPGGWFEDRLKEAKEANTEFPQSLVPEFSKLKTINRNQAKNARKSAETKIGISLSGIESKRAKRILPYVDELVSLEPTDLICFSGEGPGYVTYEAPGSRSMCLDVKGYQVIRYPNAVDFFGVSLNDDIVEKTRYAPSWRCRLNFKGESHPQGEENLWVLDCPMTTQNMRTVVRTILETPQSKDLAGKIWQVREKSLYYCSSDYKGMTVESITKTPFYVAVRDKFASHMKSLSVDGTKTSLDEYMQKSLRGGGVIGFNSSFETPFYRLSARQIRETDVLKSVALSCNDGMVLWGITIADRDRVFFQKFRSELKLKSLSSQQMPSL